jgi:hypothetical protein
VTLLRRPAPRFFVWAALLVGVAAAAGVAGLSAWIIAGTEFVAWLVVAMSERTLSGPWIVPSGTVDLDRGVQADRVEARPQVEEAVVGESPVAERPPEPITPPTEREEPSAPALVAVPAPPPPPPVAESRPPAPVTGPTGTRWNVWTLERIAQEQTPDNDELGFLIVYLRDFAGADGLLPAGFDSLVRESFGELLPRAG